MLLLVELVNVWFAPSGVDLDPFGARWWWSLVWKWYLVVALFRNCVGWSGVAFWSACQCCQCACGRRRRSALGLVKSVFAPAAECQRCV
jgi:hypothetical protein